jgi:syntaxin 1A/syntaxin 1B/2/3
MDDTNAEIQNVRNKLKSTYRNKILSPIAIGVVMEQKNQKLGATSTNSELSAEQRIRISQHGNVTKKFIDTVSEYQEIQTKYKNKYRDRLERQYKIVKPNATSQELEKVLESGADASALFAQQILMGPQHAEAKRALYDIQERHQDIVKIEKSILVRDPLKIRDHSFCL